MISLDEINHVIMIQSVCWQAEEIVSENIEASIV